MSNRFTLRAAIYLIIRQNNKILLMQRAGSGFMDGYYSLPAGHIDGNETATEAMIREAKEEINIHIKPQDLHVALTMHRKAPDSEYIDFFFECDRYTDTIQINEPHKCTDLAFYTPTEKSDNIVPYVYQALQAIDDGITYLENGWD